MIGSTFLIASAGLISPLVPVVKATLVDRDVYHAHIAPRHLSRIQEYRQDNGDGMSAEQLNFLDDIDTTIHNMDDIKAMELKALCPTLFDREQCYHLLAGHPEEPGDATGDDLEEESVVPADVAGPLNGTSAAADDASPLGRRQFPGYRCDCNYDDDWCEFRLGNGHWCFWQEPEFCTKSGIRHCGTLGLKLCDARCARIDETPLCTAVKRDGSGKLDPRC